MTMSALLSWMLCGLIVGVIARLVVAERLNISLLLTMVVGIVGGLFGGLLYALVQGAPNQPFSFSGNAWHGWIVAILGGIIGLWGYVFVYPRIWRE
jgi:uncharacterized membrane protein YeaQ/YmgE (transglycosylase-associated protein family)